MILPEHFVFKLIFSQNKHLGPKIKLSEVNKNQSDLKFNQMTYLRDCFVICVDMKRSKKGLSWHKHRRAGGPKNKVGSGPNIETPLEERTQNLFLLFPLRLERETVRDLPIASQEFSTFQSNLLFLSGDGDE